MFSVPAALWVLGCFSYFGSMCLMVDTCVGRKGGPMRKAAAIGQFVVASSIFFGFMVGAQA